MNGLIEVLAKLDWFERLDELIHWLSGVKSWKFAVSRSSGFSGQQIESMLKKYGVKVWGRGFTRETLTFRVNEKQANWAEYLLYQNHIPVFSRPFNPENASYAARSRFNARSQDRQKQNGWLESLFAALFD